VYGAELLVNMSHMAGAHTSAQILHAANGLAMAQLGPVCVALWRVAVTPVTAAKQKECLDLVVNRHPGKASFLCIVEPGTQPPDDELRKASSTMINSHGANLKCVACVIEGTGFKAAITRSVLSGIVLLIRNPVPLKMFGTVPAGTEWMREYVPMVPTNVIVEEVDRLRSLLSKQGM